MLDFATVDAIASTEAFKHLARVRVVVSTASSKPFATVALNPRISSDLSHSFWLVLTPTSLVLFEVDFEAENGSFDPSGCFVIVQGMMDKSMSDTNVGVSLVFM